MKKETGLVVTFSILSLILCVFMILCNTMIVFAEEEVVVEKPCKVIIEDAQYGDILSDLLEGDIGETVTVSVKEYPFCKVTAVYINGESIALTEDGTYTFLLKEGENTIRADFEIDNEKLAVVAGYINQAKEDGWTSLFTMENLFNLISWVLTALFSSGFLITLVKNKKIESKTQDQILNLVTESLTSSNTNQIKTFLANAFGPAIETISERLKTSESVMLAVARCMLLAQENTPEARLAIVTELTNLGKTEEELAAKVRAVIQEEKAKEEEAKKEQENAIAELEKQNETLGVVEIEEDKKTTDEDDFGQL